MCSSCTACFDAGFFNNKKWAKPHPTKAGWFVQCDCLCHANDQLDSAKPTAALLLLMSTDAAYKCICDSRRLFTSGCLCGADAAEKANKAAAEKVAAYEAKQRMLKQRDFLIKAPAAAVTFNVICTCGHRADNHSREATRACNDPQCLCVALEVK